MNVHIGKLIRKELDSQERTVSWFAKKINVTRSHAYRIFEKDNLDLKLVETISIALNHNFFQDLSDNTCLQIDDTSVSKSDTQSSCPIPQ